MILFFDGSCFPTGTEAHGAFIVKDGETVLHEHNFLEAKEGTNNIAEWGGLVAGLRYLRQHYPDAPIDIYGDSQLVIRQLTGQYACKKPHLQPYLNEARTLLDGVTWTANWVRRDKNADADRLSKKR